MFLLTCPNFMGHVSTRSHIVFDGFFVLFYKFKTSTRCKDAYYAVFGYLEGTQSGAKGVWYPFEMVKINPKISKFDHFSVIFGQFRPFQKGTGTL